MVLGLLGQLQILTVVSDIIPRAFNRSAAARAAAVDISKAFNRVQDAGLFHKRKCYGISGEVFGFILSFLSNRLNIQLMLEFLNTPLVQHFFPLTLITFLMMLCLLLLSMSIDTTVLILIVISHLICGNNQNWLLNLNLTYETLG